jgi:hypothetical protein
VALGTDRLRNSLAGISARGVVTRENTRRFVERRVEADRAVWLSGKKAVTGEQMRSRAPICASNYSFPRMRWALSRSPPDVVILVVVVIRSATAMGGAVSPGPLDHRSANLATHGGDDSICPGHRGENRLEASGESARSSALLFVCRSVHGDLLSLWLAQTEARGILIDFMIELLDYD